MTPEHDVRRRAILADLHAELAARRRERRLAQAAGVLSIGLVAITLALWLRPAPGPGGAGGVPAPPMIAQRPIPAEIAPNAPTRAAPRFEVIGPSADRAAARLQIVRTEPGILDRCLAPAPTTRVAVTTLGDDEFLELLANAGVTAGLVRTGSVVRLLRFDPPEPAPADRPTM